MFASIPQLSNVRLLGFIGTLDISTSFKARINSIGMDQRTVDMTPLLTGGWHGYVRKDMKMTNTLTKKKTINQDGPDFYYSNGELVTTYPRCVFDGDVQAAEDARTWFIETYCPSINIVPEFK